MFDIKKIDFPKIRNTFPKLIAEELISVQPMDSGCGEAVANLIKYGKSEAVKNQNLCRKAIVEHLKNGGEHVGQIECPLCGKKLIYSYVSYNGHIHGKCEGGCAWWVE